MVKSKNGGFTLIELLLAAAISLIAFWGVSDMVLSTFKKMNKSAFGLNIQSDNLLIQKYTSSTLSYTDKKTFALTGENVLDNSHARFIIPQVSKCADRSSKSACNNSASLFYSAANNKVPSLSAYCWTALGTQMLVDKNIQSASTSAAGGLTGTLPVIGIEVPSVLSLWFVKAIDPVSITYNPGTNPPATEDLKVGGVSVPSSCLTYLPRNGNLINKSLISIINVDPLYLQNTQTAPNPNLTTKLAQIFPTRIQFIDFFSMGVNNLTGKTTDTKFYVYQCFYTLTKAINCTIKPPFLIVDSISKSLLFESFYLRLQNEDPAILRYQITGSGVSQSPACNLQTGCSALQVSNNNIIPFTLTGETFENLITGNFSLIKQEALKTVTIKLYDYDNKEYQIQFAISR